MIRRRLLTAAFGATALAFAISGHALAETKPVTGAKPLSPQPAADKVEPGLAVIYFSNMFNKLNEIGKLGKGKPGEPIKLLDHKTNDGNVLTSDKSMGVGAKITGLIKFDQAGWYELAVDYFQKKGTSALQLFWTPPGGSQAPVPATQFAHFKG